MSRFGLFGSNNFTGLGLGSLEQPFGEISFTTPGTYTWTAPAGVTSVSAVVVGAGGMGAQNTFGGGGGALAWKNNITVVPGTSYEIVVGAGGVFQNETFGSIVPNGGPSTAFTMIAGGGGGSGTGGSGGSASGGTGNYSGGNGGTFPGYPNNGGGGSAGYTSDGEAGLNGVGDPTYIGGNGGNAGNWPTAGGSGNVGTLTRGGSGGGIGLYGIGVGAVRGADATDAPRQAGLYGGGAASSGNGPSSPEYAGNGAVRIIWGFGRSFPNAAGPTPPVWTVYNTNTAIPGWGNDIINDINWNGSQFLAVGNNGKVATSPNGITWTYRSNLATGTWGNAPVRAIGWDGSKYLIGGGIDDGASAPLVATSTDGITWTVSNVMSPGYTGPLWSNSPVRAIIHDGTQFIITGGDGYAGHIATGVQGTESSLYLVANSGASAYTINSSSNPTLTLQRGGTYTFDVAASGHPFWIKTAQTTGTGSAYSTGVTNNGTEIGTVTFTVPNDAPSTLYYICQVHGSMTGVINIVANTNGIIWTGRANPLGNSFGISLAWNKNPNNPRYFVAGADSYSVHSTDAITWNSDNSLAVVWAGISFPACIVYNPETETFVVGGYDTGIATSTATATPNFVNRPALGLLWNTNASAVRKIIHNNGTLVAVGDSVNSVAISIDGGITWENKTSLTTLGYSGFIYAIATNGKRYIIGGAGGRIAISSNTLYL